MTPKQQTKLKNNVTYWQKRYSNIEQAAHDKSVVCFNELSEKYRKAEAEINKEINAWYQRFAVNNKISMTEARRLLNSNELEELRWNVEQYIKAGRENAIDKRWMKELENASAKFHINRLEALKLNAQQLIEKMLGGASDNVDSMLRDVYRTSFYRSCFELQKGRGIGFDVSQINENYLDKILSKPWCVDGSNFSDRIWKEKTKLVNTLDNELTKLAITGDDPKTAIDNISKAMNVSKANASRIIMTEQAYFTSRAQADSFKELDVEMFEVCSALDSLTCSLCAELDGTHYAMTDFKPGLTAPPFHPNCRCVTVPYFDDEFDNTGERAARGKDDKTYYVPADMTYKDWKKSFVDGDKTGLQKATANDIIKVKEQKFDIKGNTTKLKGAMNDKDYAEYLARLNNHSNDDIKKLYASYADKITDVKKSPKGAYIPSSNSLTFSYPDDKYIQNGKDKYSTVAHEYGHFFDAQVQFSDLHFNEIDTVKDKLNYTKSRFTHKASLSDEFLAAVRKDKQFLHDTLTDEIKKELSLHDASDGVQDAIDGLLCERIRWGHGDKYYDRLYHSIKQMKEHKGLRQAYKDLGYDVSNLSKVSSFCRDYESASEIWANIMAAEVNGGEALEYVKKYLPSSYEAMLAILKGVE